MSHKFYSVWEWSPTYDSIDWEIMEGKAWYNKARSGGHAFDGNADHHKVVVFSTKY